MREVETDAPVHQLPKLCGGDFELANFVEGRRRPGGTGAEAARLLLREVDGVRPVRRAIRLAGGTLRRAGYTAEGEDPQDWGRKFLASNGGCVYVDLDHLELCVPEVRSARDHLVATHAMIRIARQARIRANARLPAGERIELLVNNSDGHSNSFGSHLNFLLTRTAWGNLFERRPHYLAFLASYQVSSIVFAGQGKVGAENGVPWVPYQISQRADFFETLCGPQTTFRRPLVNSRDEPLCGPPTRAPGTGYARLHCIFYDSTLCHVASWLKVGVMQIVLAMLELDAVEPRLVLEDPLGALRRWSCDPTLRARARLLLGGNPTAVELQLGFLEAARHAHAAGGLAGVPEADALLDAWEDTLLRLRDADLDALASRLDWVLKLRALERARARRPELDWRAPGLKHLDHLYAHVDPELGLYWAYERAGVVERLVGDDEIEHRVHEPPEDTRAWTRAMLLRAADEVEHVDWDGVVFRLVDGEGRSLRLAARLPDPLGATRTENAGVFEGSADPGAMLSPLGEDDEEEESHESA